MSVKQSDQLTLLRACRDFTDSGEWRGVFTYPGCGYDLVRSGLATEDKKITVSGRATLFLAGEESDDPFPESKDHIELTMEIKRDA